MKVFLARFVLAIAIYATLLSATFAQPVHQTESSLEWKCISSSVIAIGAVTDFRVPDDQAHEKYRPEYEFTVKVSETIKGAGQPTVTFRHPYDRRQVADLESIKRNLTSFLFFIDNAQPPKLLLERYPGTFPVRNPEYVYHFFSNGHQHSLKRALYVEKLKLVVAENAKFKTKESFDFEYGNFFSVQMPLDKRTESVARQILQKNDPGKGFVPYGRGLEGHSAVWLLSHFRSKDNEALLKMMLNDSTESWTQSTRERVPTGYLTIKSFPVREAAFQVLKKWNIDVNQPQTKIVLPGDQIAQEEQAAVAILDQIKWCNIDFTKPDNKTIHVQRLDFRDCNKIPSLSALSKLEQIHINGSGQVLDISDIGRSDSLATVDVFKGPIKNLQPLAGLKNLKVLKVPNGEFSDLTPLAQLKNVNDLDVSGSPVSDLEPLANLQNLTSLNISGTQVTSLEPLQRLSRIETLSANNTGINDLQQLQGLANLKQLWLSHTKVEDLSPLAGKGRLRSINVNGSPVSDLEPLSSCHGLEAVSVSQTQVKDLTPLSGIYSLKTIHASGATRVNDVSMLMNLNKLRYLELPKTGEIKGLKDLRVRNAGLTIHRQ